MADSVNLFYLEDVYPDASSLLSSVFKTVDQIVPNTIFVLDTNVLLTSFDASSNTISDIEGILLSIKSQNKLYIPARVAREFVNNRGKKIGELYLKMRQNKESLNRVSFKMDEYPLLSDNSNYNKLKDVFGNISKLVSESRKLFDALDNDIKQWHWNDNVSEVYKRIFSSEVVIELKEERAKVIEDLKFRMIHKIAPGYNDSAKLDEGIGDLIIWKTLIEISQEKHVDVILVSDDQKNDWFYKQDKVSLYPKYELFDEFRRLTNGQSVNIISFANFLKLMNAKEDTVNEIKANIVLEKLEQTKDKFVAGLSLDYLNVGAAVEQPKFGYGVVKAVEQINNGDYVLTVDFVEFGEKRLLHKLVKLRPVDMNSSEENMNIYK
ncbi:PIN domain-containing protein [Hymenobacter chitinivorans]|uniref:PIN domain-containing protein n=1 Tax=Hymenobacter chitinivorans DSM 11115 TaxID=1121954 RepID=A0A2M9AT16_9BACT|nr:PIN domain-containing protein [Hymenobacter chitinivorans]PJJ48812.1 PIN domain-containing protein [Hymenobacter chitinivorans DSM 11115]